MDEVFQVNDKVLDILDSKMEQGKKIYIYFRGQGLLPYVSDNYYY